MAIRNTVNQPLPRTVVEGFPSKAAESLGVMPQTTLRPLSKP